MIKNNITRMLTAQKVKFEIFNLPEEKISAIETAEILKVPCEMVFKTIVIKRNPPGKPILAVVPGNSTADLKAIANEVNEKKLTLATHKEAEELTRLQTGGISPLALINKGFQTLLDKSAMNFERIHISGGQRGLNIRLSPEDLVRVCNARVASISKPSDENGFSTQA